MRGACKGPCLSPSSLRSPLSPGSRLPCLALPPPVPWLEAASLNYNLVLLFIVASLSSGRFWVTDGAPVLGLSRGGPGGGRRECGGGDVPGELSGRPFAPLPPDSSASVLGGGGEDGGGEGLAQFKLWMVFLPESWPFFAGREPQFQPTAFPGWRGWGVPVPEAWWRCCQPKQEFRAGQGADEHQENQRHPLRRMESPRRPRDQPSAPG